jgi:hypothetical protein
VKRKQKRLILLSAVWADFRSAQLPRYRLTHLARTLAKQSTVRAFIDAWACGAVSVCSYSLSSQAVPMGGSQWSDLLCPHSLLIAAMEISRRSRNNTPCLSGFLRTWVPCHVRPVYLHACRLLDLDTTTWGLVYLRSASSRLFGYGSDANTRRRIQSQPSPRGYLASGRV